MTINEIEKFCENHHLRAERMTINPSLESLIIVYDHNHRKLPIVRIYYDEISNLTKQHLKDTITLHVYRLKYVHFNLPRLLRSLSRVYDSL
jgi:hypothetical protein